jgi:hypothetical protein
MRGPVARRCLCASAQPMPRTPRTHAPPAQKSTREPCTAFPAARRTPSDAKSRANRRPRNRPPRGRLPHPPRPRQRPPVHTRSVTLHSWRPFADSASATPAAREARTARKSAVRPGTAAGDARHAPDVIPRSPPPCGASNEERWEEPWRLASTSCEMGVSECSSHRRTHHRHTQNRSA